MQVVYRHISKIRTPSVPSKISFSLTYAGDSGAESGRKREDGEVWRGWLLLGAQAQGISCNRYKVRPDLRSWARLWRAPRAVSSSAARLGQHVNITGQVPGSRWDCETPTAGSRADKNFQSGWGTKEESLERVRGQPQSLAGEL